jgi:hypothetical protein
MTDRRAHAPDESRADDRNLGGEGDGDSPKPRTASDGDVPELADVVDDPERQRGDESGLPDDDEQDWEEQEAVKGASEGGDDAELDKRLSDDQEQ